VRWQKNNSFVNFGLQGWLAAVCKCVVLWAGFLLSLCGGEKKQNKFPQVFTDLSKNYFNSFSILSLSYQVIGVFFAQCPLIKPHSPLDTLYNFPGKKKKKNTGSSKNEDNL